MRFPPKRVDPERASARIIVANTFGGRYGRSKTGQSPATNDRPGAKPLPFAVRAVLVQRHRVVERQRPGCLTAATRSQVVTARSPSRPWTAGPNCAYARKTPP